MVQFQIPASKIEDLWKIKFDTMELMHKLWIYPPRITVEVRRTTMNADSRIRFITEGNSQILNIDLSFPLSEFIEIDKVHG